MQTKVSITLKPKQYETYIILSIAIIFATLLRFSLSEFESGDFKNFLAPWYDFITEQEGFAALKYEFSNYTPPYLYLLIIASLLLSSLSKVLVIKSISIIFDFVCAFFVYKIVRIKYPTGMAPLFAFFAIVLAPTILLNSAFWGQSDIIYTTCLVACVYLLMVKKEILAMAAFGLAFAFKLQAIFLAPFLLILLLKKRISWTSLLVVPVIYVLAILPAAVTGRPFRDLLLIYVNQSNYYEALTKNAPNLYQWLPNELYDIFYPAGLIWTFLIVFMLLIGVYKSKLPLTDELMILLATISVVTMPYFLPKMHDRYFFAADVFAIIFAFFFPRYFFVPITTGMVSLFAYFPFLFGREIIPLSLLAVVLAWIIVFLVRQLVVALQPQEKNRAWRSLDSMDLPTNHDTKNVVGMESAPNNFRAQRSNATTVVRNDP
jgi:Gpi18-like mannosyltransferase